MKTMFKVINFFKNNKNSTDIIYLCNKKVTSDIKTVIVKAIDIKETINNKIKELDKIDAYKRSTQDKIDFTNLASEIVFSKYLLDLMKELTFDEKKDLDIDDPEFTGIFLNHKTEDFTITHKNERISFDVKAQLYSNKYQYLTINQKAAKRFDEHKSDFYLVALMDGEQVQKDGKLTLDYNSVTSVDYYLMSKEFFEKHREEINQSHNNSANFSPYFRVELKHFIDKKPKKG